MTGHKLHESTVIAWYNHMIGQVQCMWLTIILPQAFQLLYLCEFHCKVWLLIKLSSNLKVLHISFESLSYHGILYNALLCFYPLLLQAEFVTLSYLLEITTMGVEQLYLLWISTNLIFKTTSENRSNQHWGVIEETQNRILNWY